MKKIRREYEPAGRCNCRIIHKPFSEETFGMINKEAMRYTKSKIRHEGDETCAVGIVVRKMYDELVKLPGYVSAGYKPLSGESENPIVLDDEPEMSEIDQTLYNFCRLCVLFGPEDADSVDYSPCFENTKDRCLSCEVITTEGLCGLQEIRLTKRKKFINSICFEDQNDEDADYEQTIMENNDCPDSDYDSCSGPDSDDDSDDEYYSQKLREKANKNDEERFEYEKHHNYLLRNRYIRSFLIQMSKWKYLKPDNSSFSTRNYKKDSLPRFAGYCTSVGKVALTGTTHRYECAMLKPINLFTGNLYHCVRARGAGVNRFIF